MLKSSQVINCPVCKKSKLHSRVGNRCSCCGYILEESDFQYGVIRYAVGLTIIMGLLWLFKGIPLLHLGFYLFFILLLNPSILTKIGVKRLKVKKIGMTVAYIVWILFLFVAVITINWEYLSELLF